MREIIIDLQESDTCKNQLTNAINFIFSKTAEEERVMHSKSDNIKFMYYNEANEVVDKLFDLLRSRYQDHLENERKLIYFLLSSTDVSQML